ncbi:MAG: N-acetylneuraminate synthase family protein [Candidatus Saganbacteria bacterium]|nr:N-acetylneuraminate synthase family protein [Candidatus Saganbacteria bacterium]
MKFKVGKRMIGQGEPLYFIADIAANHDGDLDRAFRLIDLAKKAGADAAKFQNFQAAKIVSRKGFDSLGSKLSHQSKWKKSVFETYQDASIPFDWTEKLKKKCDEVGIDYFTSPYDFESVDRVDPYLDVYKVGSGDITWLEILDYIARKGKPVILAAGASSLEDVDRAMELLGRHTKELVLMQCNTNYTAVPENFKYINLNVLRTFAKRYPDAVLGLSDHTHGHATVLGAVALGAVVFEKHFSDDNSREGPDHRFAMNPVSWREMVDRANELYLSLGDGVKKVEQNEQDSYYLQRRGLRFAKDLKSGRVIAKADLISLRPLDRNGVAPYEMDKVVSKKLTQDVSADDPVVMEVLK